MTTVFLSDVVQLAADTIRDHPDRWIQGAYQTDYRWTDGGRDGGGRWDTCSACAHGMISVAAAVLGYRDGYDAENDTTEAASLVDQVAEDLTGERDGLAAYNDDAGRTPRQVAGVLDDIADALRDDGQ